MCTVPDPLCWNTLSDADLAPPPITYESPLVPLKVAASSPTSSHQTFWMVQRPSQCTPSPAGDPKITFLSVAPFARSNMAGWLSPWPPSPMQQYRFMPPSSVPLTLTVPVTVTSPVFVGQVGTVAADAGWVSASVARTAVAAVRRAA